MRILGRILLHVFTVRVNRIKNIEYRVSRSHLIEAEELMDHFEKSIQFIRENSYEDYKIFRASVRTIYFIPTLGECMEFTPNVHKLAVRIPYCLDYKSSKYSDWFIGLSACLLVRVSHVSEIVFHNKRVGSKIINSEFLEHAKLQERLFALNVGGKWKDYYGGVDPPEMPNVGVYLPR